MFASDRRRHPALWFALLSVFAWLIVAAPAPVTAAPPVSQPKAATPKAATPKAAPKPATGTPPAAESKPAAGAKADTSKRETELYGDRIDALQGDVDQLKEKILRSKARLNLLKETVLRGVMAGSRVMIAHRNQMSSQFRLTKLVVVLDGAQISSRTDDSGALDAEDELVVYDSNLVPGPHTLTVELTYRGQGFGVFSYLNNYTFESTATHSFTAPENGALKLLSVGFEKGNLTTEMKDRPAIDFQEVALDASGKPLPRGAKKRRRGKSSASGKASGSASAGKSKGK